ncbi:MAG: response regulator [Syntrophales bacterium]|nr:response regulator [Syntrophales bacterium]
MDKTNLLGSHVLLAEDNTLNQQVAIELLEMVGAKIDLATDGEETVKMAIDALGGKEQYRYDCILMDIQMPKIDGFEATRLIRRIDSLKSVPIIALTAQCYKGR